MLFFLKKNIKYLAILFFPLLLMFFLNNEAKDKWMYPVNKINSGDKIVAFGDSLTYGYNLPETDNYPNSLQKLLNDIDVVNYGVNGNTTEDGLRRIDEMLEQENPQLVILSLGGNDFLRNVKSEKIIENLEKMIDKIKTNGSEVILLPVPNPSYFKKIVARITGLEDSPIYEKIAERKKVPIVKNVFSELLVKDKYKIDFIHLNKEGYELVAEKIYEQMKKNNVID